MTCARCNNHKYDDITQKEYYRLYAFFNNGDETTTKVAHSTAERLEYHIAHARWEKALEQAEQELEAAKDGVEARFSEWATATADKLRARPPLEYEILHWNTFRGPEGVTFTEKEDGSILVGGNDPDTATYKMYGDIPSAEAEGRKLAGIRLEVIPDASLERDGPGRQGNFVLNDIRLYLNNMAEFTQDHRLRFTDAKANFSQDGWPVVDATDGKEGPRGVGIGWAIVPHYGKRHWAEFYLPETIDISKDRHLHLVLSQLYGTRHTIGRYRLSAILGERQNLVPESLAKILLKPAAEREEAETEALMAHYLTLDAKTSPSAAALAELRRNEPGYGKMTVRVITERARNPRQAHILRRGEFKQPMEPVEPGTFSALPPLVPRNPGQPADRLDLARWLVSGENPLPPRVTVNQVWAHLFGEGIVETVVDFGVRGERPSHPELLDWLAREFIERGWSRKELIKLIVTSATYRQAADYRLDLINIDPANRLLARQNRFRVEAETVRDLTLSASGLLSRKVGGPSVFPPIPNGVTDLTYNSSFNWKVSDGGDRYRRGMYTFFKRTAPHPNLMTFDCPDSNLTTVQRRVSNTPLAALVTLNNQVYAEAAVALAARVLANEALENDSERLARAFRLCVARPPDPAELDSLLGLLQTSRAWYGEHLDAAAEMTGAFGIPTNASPAELAAHAATVRVLLNLDEFITRN